MQFLYVFQLLVLIVGPLVKMVMKMIGFGFVTYYGSNLIIGAAQQYVVNNLGSTAINIQQILGLAKIDVAINIYFAAISTRMILSGLDKIADRKRNQVWNPPGRGYIDA